MFGSVLGGGKASSRGGWFAVALAALVDPLRRVVQVVPLGVPHVAHAHRQRLVSRLPTRDVDRDSLAVCGGDPAASERRHV